MYRSAMMRGDPGFLGGLFGVARKVAGTVAGTIGGMIPGPGGAVLRQGGRIIGGSTPPSGMGGMPTFAGISGGGSVTTTQTRAVAGHITATGEGGCPKGFKLNKSGYHLRDGTYVAPRTRCVKIRTRNVANGRALRRAVSRASSFEKLVKRNRKGLRALAKI